MSFVTLVLLALAMSTDAFAVAVCKGIAMRTPQFKDALKLGLLFGFIEAITPILGWLLGYIASQFISQWDHWVIFILMLFLGGRMLRNGFSAQEACDGQEPRAKESILLLIFTAISTSIDAFAVGISLALASVNIGFAAGLIGFTTCVCVTIGILLGKKIGNLVGKRAEIVGGLVLIIIGCVTLYEHFIVR